MQSPRAVPLAVEGGVDGSASRGGRAGEPEGRPRMSGPEGVAACVWPEVGAGWLICVHPACVGGRPRSEAQPLAAAAERAGLWKGLQESRGPLSRPCVTDLPLSFRPWVRVTGVTLRFMASREQSFSSAAPGVGGARGVRAAGPGMRRRRRGALPGRGPRGPSVAPRLRPVGTGASRGEGAATRILADGKIRRREGRHVPCSSYVLFLKYGFQ